jgi:uncharacterized DUF497 family protein
MDEKWRRAARFEFDERKSRINRLKHGIDFIEAQALWLDPKLLRAPARNAPEERFVVVGLLDGKHWSAVATICDDAVRLISVRRSRAKEVEAYESQ